MKNIRFLSENFHFLVVKFSGYLNRLVFVMCTFQNSLRIIRVVSLEPILQYLMILYVWIAKFLIRLRG